MLCIDMIGARCGRLTVTGRASNNPRGQARWFCLCECGKEIVANGYSLRTGATKSCGCWRDEILAVQQQPIHGHGRRNKRTPEYMKWKNARHFRKTNLEFTEFLKSLPLQPLE